MPDDAETAKLQTEILQTSWACNDLGKADIVIHAQVGALLVSIFAASPTAETAEWNFRSIANNVLSDIKAAYGKYQEQARTCHEAHEATRQ